MPFIRFALILLLALSPLGAPAAEYTLVVHRDNPVDRLELGDVRKIFLGKKTFWPQGDTIEVCLQAESDLHRDFALGVLSKSPRQLKMYWKRVLFSGEGVPPRELPDDQAVLQMVSSNPKAIGYLDSQFLDDSVKPVGIDREQ